MRRWVELILRQYLAPLPPFGPDGGGWPLGRAVRRAELEAVAVQVEGVEYLEGLGLAVGRPGSPGRPRSTSSTLERWEVPERGRPGGGAGDPLPLGDDLPARPAHPPEWSGAAAPEVC